MNNKSLFLTSIFSSVLTAAIFIVFFAWNGSASAQQGVTETGEGLSSAFSPTGLAAPGAVMAPQANMSHWFIMGSHLLPRETGVEYAYGGNGCMYVTANGGAIRMQFPVSLPDGAIVKSMDIIFNDTSASTLIVWLTSYAPGISSGDLLSVASSGTAGYGTASSTEITHVIDNNLNAYSINYSWAGVIDTTLQICGIRINYIDPFFASFLPAMIK